MSSWGGVGAAGGGRDLGGEVVDFVDGEKDGLLTCTVVVESSLNYIFDGGTGERWEALFPGGVGLMVHVGIPIDVVCGYGVFAVVVVVVGVGTGWRGGRGRGVGFRVFLGFVGILGGVGLGVGFRVFLGFVWILGGVGAGWGLGGGDAGWGLGWGWRLGGSGTGWGRGWSGVGGGGCGRDGAVDAGWGSWGRLGDREEGWVEGRDGKGLFKDGFGGGRVLVFLCFFGFLLVREWSEGGEWDVVGGVGEAVLTGKGRRHGWREGALCCERDEDYDGKGTK